jgi:hypothetical protein
MAAKTLPEYFIQYRNEINPVTGEQRLYRDITDQMIWDAATKAAEEKFTAGHNAPGIAPTTTQGTKPCAGCKHADESEEPNRNSFSNCHLCKRTHKDYFERTASPVA